MTLCPPVVDRDVPTLDVTSFGEALQDSGDDLSVSFRSSAAEEPDHRCSPLLRARRERPCSRRAAERDQQFPPSDGDCHTPLPCEVRKRQRYHATHVLS